MSEIKPKLALSIITKGEYQNLDRLLKTVAQFVDGIFITHTSKENEKETKEVCTKYGAVYSYFAWVDDFSTARKFAQSQIAPDFTHMLWLDCDDVLLYGGSLRGEFEAMVAEGAKSLAWEYYYMLSPEGLELFFKTGQVDPTQLLQTLTRERIVALDGSFEWAGALHENLVPTTTNMRVKSTNKLKVVHLSTPKEFAASNERNFRIIQKMREEEVKSGQIDPRTTYLLARNYFDIKTEEALKKAEELFKEHIATSGWDEEICQAWNYLADIYRFQGQLPQSLSAGFEALKTDPRFPEVYAGISMTYALSGRYERSYFWAKKGLATEEPSTTIVRKPRTTRSFLLLSVSEAAFKLGLVDEAWAAAYELAKLMPQDMEIKSRLAFINDYIQEREITKRYAMLADFLSNMGQTERVEFLVKSIPAIYVGNPILSAIRKQYVKPTKWEDGSVVFYCGPGFELWSPENLKKGIGGSEEAIIYLSWELAKRGRKVVVYGDPPVEKTYDGVEYRVYSEFNPEDEFDTLVIWRRPDMLDNELHAKRILLDLHDVPSAVDFTPERVARVTKILVKSQYHREFIPNVPDEKIAVISNGINIHQLEEIKPEWKPQRLFYGSSYDRGLENLLATWKDVKKEFPDAKLHVCYGWDLFDTAHRSNPERMAWKEKMQGLLKQDGIIHHGRIGQRELSVLMSKCSIWAYPTTFEEINCITGLRAQALGLIPVINNYAALKETVKFGEIVPVDGHVKSPKQRKAYLEALLTAMRNEGKFDRDQTIRWARENYSWEKIGSIWAQLLEETPVESPTEASGASQKG